MTITPSPAEERAARAGGRRAREMRKSAWTCPYTGGPLRRAWNEGYREEVRRDR